jgi:hypothetical protein
MSLGISTRFVYLTVPKDSFVLPTYQSAINPAKADPSGMYLDCIWYT